MITTEQQLQTHPIADLIPSMSEEEYRGLIEDIKVNGLIDPIYLFEGRILDGRHRYRACLELRIEPRFEEYQGDSPVAFVISRNLKRRHLTESQRAALAVELLPYIEKEARERQIKAGKEGEKYGVLGGRGIKKGSNEYNEKVLQLSEQDTQGSENQNDSTDDESHTGDNGEKPLGGNLPPRGFGEGRSTEIAAKLVDSNSKYVKTAKKLSQQAPEVFEAVKEGKVNLAQAKKIIDLPIELKQPVIERIKSSGDSTVNVKRIITEIRKSHIGKEAEEGGLIDLSERCNIIHGDMLLTLELPAQSVDWIITDPPYPENQLEVWSKLSTIAGHVLKPGGLLLAMCGQFHLPEVINRLKEQLQYRWMIAYLTPGGQSVQIFPRKVNTFWKPVLVFGLKNTEYTGPWFGDVARSAVNDNDKKHHHWGQSESGMFDLMRRFVRPGDTVLDPCLGGGTTAVIALKLGAKFIGYDLDEQAIRSAKQRIHLLTEQPPEPLQACSDLSCGVVQSL
jgi:site-specific DNA-methyltransferase (adenine-specific)